MKLIVIGAGYVGLVTGVCLASKGHKVTIVERSKERLDLLKRDVSPIYEPGLEELMKRFHNNIAFVSNLSDGYSGQNIFFLCVGTPQAPDGSADLQDVYDSVESILKYCKEESLLVIKSTVPVGTNNSIQEMVAQRRKKIHVVSNPEFLQQGKAVLNTLYPSRLVIGAEDEYSIGVMKELYKDFNCPTVCVNRASAEMIKYASNNYLALKISYINEVANLCDKTGADVMDVVKGMSFDKRIGSDFLQPGIGFGGSCFPKDTKALLHVAKEHGMEFKTIQSLIEINEDQKYKLIEKAEKKLGNLCDKRIAVLGLTFKAGTDDVRESPAIAIVKRLIECGAEVNAWDKMAIEVCKKKLNHEKITYCNSIEECLKDADACFITTEWTDIVNVDAEVFLNYMKTPFVFDGKNCLNREYLKTHGIIYEGIGCR